VSADDPTPRELHRRARTILARLEHFEGGARFGLVPRTPDVEEVATAVMDLHETIGSAARADRRLDDRALEDLVAARALLLEAAALAERLLDAVRPEQERRRSG
jgi:hypothetical protein